MIVVDANVLLAAMRSSNGASHVVLRALIAGQRRFAVSPAVVVEYEDVLKRPGILGRHSTIGMADIDVVLDAMLSRARLVSPHFRFRPFLDDPKDDLYIECALSAGANTIVSNDKHFNHPAMAAFGLTTCKASDIARQLATRSTDR
jgi:putative PIN family toxin of toxin-antitoxin system